MPCRVPTCNSRVSSVRCVRVITRLSRILLHVYLALLYAVSCTCISRLYAVSCTCISRVSMPFLVLALVVFRVSVASILLHMLQRPVARSPAGLPLARSLSLSLSLSRCHPTPSLPQVLGHPLPRGTPLPHPCRPPFLAPNSHVTFPRTLIW